MKKLLSVFLVILFVMSGCTILDKPIKKVQISSYEYVCNELHDKYNENFVIDYIGDRINTEHTKLYVHSEKKNIRFTVIVDRKTKEIKDDYVAQRMNCKIDSIVSESFSNECVLVCSDCQLAFGEYYNIPDRDYTPSEFLKEADTDHFTLYVIIDNNTSNGDKISKALVDAGEKTGIELVVIGYTFDSDNFNKCQKLIESYPSVNSTTLEDNNPVSSFTGVVKNGKVKVTSGKFDF